MSNTNEDAYAVVQFLKLPYESMDMFVCVPCSWITNRTLPDQTIVLVSYPIEDPETTKKRVEKRESHGKNWSSYLAIVKKDNVSYDDAIVWITTEPFQGNADTPGNNDQLAEATHSKIEINTAAEDIINPNKEIIGADSTNVTKRKLQSSQPDDLVFKKPLMEVVPWRNAQNNRRVRCNQQESAGHRKDTPDRQQQKKELVNMVTNEELLLDPQQDKTKRSTLDNQTSTRSLKTCNQSFERLQQQCQSLFADNSVHQDHAEEVILLGSSSAKNNQLRTWSQEETHVKEAIKNMSKRSQQAASPQRADQNQSIGNESPSNQDHHSNENITYRPNQLNRNGHEVSSDIYDVTPYIPSTVQMSTSLSNNANYGYIAQTSGSVKTQNTPNCMQNLPNVPNQTCLVSEQSYENMHLQPHKKNVTHEPDINKRNNTRSSIIERRDSQSILLNTSSALLNPVDVANQHCQMIFQQKQVSPSFERYLPPNQFTPNAIFRAPGSQRTFRSVVNYSKDFKNSPSIAAQDFQNQPNHLSKPLNANIFSSSIPKYLQQKPCMHMHTTTVPTVVHHATVVPTVVHQTQGIPNNIPYCVQKSANSANYSSQHLQRPPSFQCHLVQDTRTGHLMHTQSAGVNFTNNGTFIQGATNSLLFAGNNISASSNYFAQFPERPKENQLIQVNGSHQLQPDVLYERPNHMSHIHKSPYTHITTNNSPCGLQHISTSKSNFCPSCIHPFENRCSTIAQDRSYQHTRMQPTQVDKATKRNCIKKTVSPKSSKKNVPSTIQNSSNTPKQSSPKLKIIVKDKCLPVSILIDDNDVEKNTSTKKNADDKESASQYYENNKGLSVKPSTEEHVLENTADMTATHNMSFTDIPVRTLNDASIIEQGNTVINAPECHRNKKPAVIQHAADTLSNDRATAEQTLLIYFTNYFKNMGSTISDSDIMLKGLLECDEKVKKSLKKINKYCAIRIKETNTEMRNRK